MAYTKRDSKDPMPTASNTQRSGKDGGGNTTVTGEKHDQKKGRTISAASRFDGTVSGPEQPTRQNAGGNLPVTGEAHGQKKARTIPASSRF